MHAPLVIAHRGDSSNALENSLEAIRRALVLSVDMIELDIRKSSDDHLFVMHDKDTKRTAQVNIDIEHATSKELAKVKLKNNEPIPTLSDILTLVAGAVGLNLEIKSKGAGALTARHILSSGYTGAVLLSSFKNNEVLAARKIMPELPTSMIFDIFTVRHVLSYKAEGYEVISLGKKTVSEKLIVACHKQGIRVYVWTVDDEDEMKKLASWGVDGIYSNKPALLKEIMRNKTT